MRGAHRSGKVHCSSRNQDPQRDHYQRFGGSRYINLRAGCDNDIKPDSDPMPASTSGAASAIAVMEDCVACNRSSVGGLDSAVALYWAKAQGGTCFPWSLNIISGPGGSAGPAGICVIAPESERHLRSHPFPEGSGGHAGDGDRQPALAKAPQGYVPLRNLISMRWRRTMPNWSPRGTSSRS